MSGRPAAGERHSIHRRDNWTNARRIAASCALASLGVWLMAGRPPDETLWWDSVFDVGHIPLFAVATAILLDLVHVTVTTETSPWREVGLTAVIIAGLAAVSELAQLADPTRSASVGDFLRDTAGVALYLAARETAARMPSPRALTTWTLVVAGTAAIGVVPLWNASTIYWSRARAFPDILTFRNSPWERALAFTSAVEPASCNAAAPEEAVWCDHLVPTAFYPDVFAGFELQEVEPDWSGHLYLTMCVGVPAASAGRTLAFRFQDARLARRGRAGPVRRHYLTAGMNVVSIPLLDVSQGSQWPLDLANMRRIAVFVDDVDRPTTLFLGSLRLATAAGQPCTRDVGPL